ncbi:hypothetical protein DL89DRAFT_75830 [Linderina pennispora]|uniref:Uncharacterized protein n=1 Tax=Linderina pennispora TaxID=61395 RepID=A0A1Y1VYC0_9FUNG|nr:uncharacterized protein DL89DRAFT_75830 [Linderina pennispora]ORX66035.1 hypothetical protein DL89DRAFT_75830 [Linderina pennispora]
MHAETDFTTPKNLRRCALLRLIYFQWQSLNKLGTKSQSMYRDYENRLREIEALPTEKEQEAEWQSIFLPNHQWTFPDASHWIGSLYHQYSLHRLHNSSSSSNNNNNITSQIPHPHHRQQQQQHPSGLHPRYYAGVPPSAQPSRILPPPSQVYHRTPTPMQQRPHGTHEHEAQRDDDSEMSVNLSPEALMGPHEHLEQIVYATGQRGATNTATNKSSYRRAHKVMHIPHIITRIQ